jgi:hypothetical protein
MPTRRNVLLTGAAFAMVGTPTWGFDADSAPLRYRNWVTRFRHDIEMLRAGVAGTAGASEEQVGINCSSSIVPHSRATLMVSEWLTDLAHKRDASRYAGLSFIAILLLEDSVPAGYGGLFQEAPEIRFPSGRFSVWYMHVGGPDALQAYFDDKTQFPHYELPATGTLKRHAYPFLLFEDTGNALRLAGISAEWMGAAIYLQRKQYS